MGQEGKVGMQEEGIRGGGMRSGSFGASARGRCGGGGVGGWSWTGGVRALCADISRCIALHYTE